MAITESVGAQTGAPDRHACTSSAPPGAHSSSTAPVHPSGRLREPVRPAQPPVKGDGGLQRVPAPRESTMALTGSVGAQTGAPDRLARFLTAPLGAHSSSTAPAHPLRRPCELARPGQSPEQGDGGPQHAPVLRESTLALTESAGAQTGAPDRHACTLSAPPGAHSSSTAPVHPSGRPRELVRPAQSPAQGDGGLQHAPAPRESTMTLTVSVGAQTGAPDRLARILTAPPGAHSSSTAPAHPPRRPRELARPGQSPEQGDGGPQHAPVLRESTTALIEGVGPPPLSVPLHRQHEDRGREATDPPTLVPSPHTDTGERPPFGACSWTGSFHAPTGYLALLATSGPPDPGSNARFKLPPSSS